MRLRRAVASLIAALSCGTLLRATAAPAMQEDSDQVFFDDPRPLAAAVLELEHRCHCVITYEDLKWTQAQVQDAAEVQTRPERSRIQLPKGQAFGVTLARKIGLTAPSEVPAAVQAVFQAFEEAGNQAAFRFVPVRNGFHVMPIRDAVFDVRVTLPLQTRSAFEAITDVSAAAGAASGSRILIGRVPLSLLMQTKTDVGARDERFGEVLTRILAYTGRSMSWRLLYDFGMKTYYLNLHGVE